MRAPSRFRKREGQPQKRITPSPSAMEHQNTTLFPSGESGMMAGRRILMWLVFSAGLFAAAGAGCPHMVRQYTAPIPRMLPPSPDYEQIVQVVNRNSSAVESYIAREAKVTTPGLPPLQVTVVYQKPRRFRMRAETVFTGTEVDVGCNDELFWFWIRRPAPATMCFCRHDEYASSPARQMLPIDPNWLIEALGIVYLDPHAAHEGPYPVGENRLELRTPMASPEGTMMRATVVDAETGFVTEQRVYDPNGQLLARASSDNPRRDPLTGLILPRTVRVESPPANFSIKVELGNVDINPTDGINAELFQVPAYENTRTIDLARVVPQMQAPQIPAEPVGNGR